MDYISTTGLCKMYENVDKISQLRDLLINSHVKVKIYVEKAF